MVPCPKRTVVVSCVPFVLSLSESLRSFATLLLVFCLACLLVFHRRNTESSINRRAQGKEFEELKDQTFVVVRDKF